MLRQAEEKRPSRIGQERSQNSSSRDIHVIQEILQSTYLNRLKPRMPRISLDKALGSH
jgi:hypothetical protein